MSQPTYLPSMPTSKSVESFRRVIGAVLSLFRWDDTRLVSLLQAVSQMVPRILLLKVLTSVVLLLNMRSLPLAWHIRVFTPVLRIRGRNLLLRLQTLFKSRIERQRECEAFLDGLCPVGAHPLEFETTYKTWASLDDCDFNGHLSNSSYAKVLDMSRFELGTASFPHFFRSGGWVALAGTNYAFIREIPMLAAYEIRLSIVAWDNKWLYVASRFITHTKPTKNTLKSDTAADTHSTPLFPTLRTPASGLTTPLPSTSTTPPTDAAEAPTDTLRALTASLLHTPPTEPDGATLHCVSVSQCCFKHGRITVPPAIVLASHGFSGPAPSGEGYSKANPPPHWERARGVLGNGDREGGGKGKGAWRYRAFLRGGWREGERWWEEALGGSLEEQRRANLGVLEGIRRGMEVVRSL